MSRFLAPAAAVSAVEQLANEKKPSQSLRALVSCTDYSDMRHQLHSIKAATTTAQEMS